MRPSYKQKTLALTGWTDAEYKREYTRFAQKVRNFNAATGADYSAARMFYNAQKPQEASKALSAILRTPATRAHTVGEKPASRAVQTAARSYVEDRFSGLASRSNYVKEQLDALKAGKQSIETTNKKIVAHINAAKLNAKVDPGSYASALYA